MNISKCIIGELQGFRIIESGKPVMHKQALIYNKVMTMLRIQQAPLRR